MRFPYRARIWLKQASRAAIAILATTLLGCSHPTADVNPSLERLANDVNAIARESGGDWNKLSQSQRDVMLKAANSNEREAKELLFGLSGKTYEGKWGSPAHPPAHPLFGNPAGIGGTGK